MLDDQARKVGTTFARLLGYGYSVGQSLRFSRAHAIMNRQYGVVGDGTHVLTQGQSISPMVLTAKKTPSDEYLLSSDSCSPRFHGAIYQLDNDSKPVLVGNDNSHLVSEVQFERYLHTLDEPVIFEDLLYWPEELLEELF